MSLSIQRGIGTVTYYSGSENVRKFLNELEVEYTTRFVQRNFYGTEFSIVIPKKRNKLDKAKYDALMKYFKS